jgi:hypothetical protein
VAAQEAQKEYVAPAFKVDADSREAIQARGSIELIAQWRKSSGGYLRAHGGLNTDLGTLSKAAEAILSDDGTHGSLPWWHFSQALMGAIARADAIAARAGESADSVQKSRELSGLLKKLSEQ